MNKEKKAWVVTAHMGLGHMRAAWAFKKNAKEKIIVHGNDPEYSSVEESRLLSRIRKIYYFFSRAMEFPLLGGYIFGILDKMMKFSSLYSKNSETGKTLGTWLLDILVKRKSICGTIAEKISCDLSTPVIHTFYATAVALDKLCQNNENWLIVTDTDINRVWVAGNPEKSRIKYLVPCGRTKRRLLKYGVKEENIFLTGFPLPLENVGSMEKHEILSADIAKRIVKLDKNMGFRKMYGRSCLEILGIDSFPQTGMTVTLMYAIGGSGVQASTALKIIISLEKAIIKKDFELYISCGVNRSLYERIMTDIAATGKEHLIDSGVHLIYSSDFDEYYRSFNQMLRKTDILWTKPSEMSFYCALGIPLITSEPVGYHERINRRWLREIHAAIRASGRPEDCSEWLYDLIDSGILAQTAWNGFLNAEKMGTYNILETVFSGKTQKE
jgi:hypothetical protein